jgi:hypothetical protein
MKTRSLLAFAVSVAVLLSCSSSSKLTHAWNDPEVTSHSFEKLTVMAIFPNMQVRTVSEDAMVRELAKRGIKAKPSYVDFPLAGQAKQFIGLAKDTGMVQQMKTSLQQKIKDKGIDGLIFINPFDIQKTTEYHEGSSISITGPAYGNYPGYYGNASPLAYRGSYYDYYTYAVGTVYSPGYYSTSTTYYLQTNLFDVETEKLIWAAQTKTVDYKNLEKEADQLASLLISDLAKRNIVLADSSALQ